MDSSENEDTLLFNENVYIPASDNEYESDEYDPDLCVLQPVSHNHENDNTNKVHEEENRDTDSGLYQNQNEVHIQSSPSTSPEHRDEVNIPSQTNLQEHINGDNSINSDSNVEQNSDTNIGDSELEENPNGNLGEIIEQNSDTNIGDSEIEENPNGNLGEIEPDANNTNLEDVYQRNLNIHQPPNLFNVYDTDSNSDNEEPNNFDTSFDNNIQREFMTNYDRDEDDPNDFASGWEWKMEDRDGSSHGPFTGTPGLRIQPQGQSPLDYVKLFVPNSFLFHVAEQTNIYATNKQQGKNIFHVTITFYSVLI